MSKRDEMAREYADRMHISSMAKALCTEHFLAGYDAATEAHRGLVEALKFYQMERNYVLNSTGTCGDGCCTYYEEETAVAKDCGDIARAALASHGGERE